VRRRSRRLVGVLDDVDLLASEHRPPFRLRARSPAAHTVAASPRLRPSCGAVIALHDAGTSAPAISRMIASLHDTRDAAADRAGAAESGPESSGRSRAGHGQRSAARARSELGRRLRARDGRRRRIPSSGPSCCALAERVLAGWPSAAWSRTATGRCPPSRCFARSVAGWEAATHAWLEDPDRGRGLMLLSVVVESSPVWGATAAPDRLARRSRRRPAARTRCGGWRSPRWPSVRRPASSAIRARVLRRAQGHAGHQARRPAADRVARALERPRRRRERRSTLARLRVADTAARSRRATPALLADAFELVCALRMEHQVEQLRAGRPPDDLIDPAR
jgi:CBS domain-containing protein